MNNIHPKERHRLADDKLLNACGGLLEEVEELKGIVAQILEWSDFITREWAKTLIELNDERKKRTAAMRYANKRITELDGSYKGLLRWWHENQPKGKWNEPYKYQ